MLPTQQSAVPAAVNQPQSAVPSAQVIENRYSAVASMLPTQQSAVVVPTQDNDASLFEGFSKEDLLIQLDQARAANDFKAMHILSDRLHQMSNVPVIPQVGGSLEPVTQFEGLSYVELKMKFYQAMDNNDYDSMLPLSAQLIKVRQPKAVAGNTQTHNLYAVDTAKFKGLSRVNLENELYKSLAKDDFDTVRALVVLLKNKK